MTIRLTGDLGAINKLVVTLSDPDRVLTSASKSMGEEALDFTKERYRLETDPYGKRWKPKKANDGRKTLSGPTSRLKGGWKRKRADKEGFEIEASVTYGEPHQRPKRGRGGKLKRPRRMQVPDPDKGMPTELESRLNEAATDVLQAKYGR